MGGGCSRPLLNNVQKKDGFVYVFLTMIAKSIEAKSLEIFLIPMELVFYFQEPLSKLYRVAVLVQDLPIEFNP